VRRNGGSEKIKDTDRGKGERLVEITAGKYRNSIEVQKNEMAVHPRKGTRSEEKHLDQEKGLN